MPWCLGSFLLMSMCRLWTMCKYERLPRRAWGWLCWLWFTAVIRFHYKSGSQCLCVFPDQHDRLFVMNWLSNSSELVSSDSRWILMHTAMSLLSQKLSSHPASSNLGLFIALFYPLHEFTVVFFRCYCGQHHDQRMETWWTLRKS